MTAAATIDCAKLLEIFRERCEARAHLVANGLHDLQDSVDTLQAAAEAQGLVDELGQDGVQKILSEVFARRKPRDDELAPADRQRGPGRTAASTINAFWYVVGLRDQKRFKAFLADHPYDAPFLLKLMEGK